MLFLTCKKLKKAVVSLAAFYFSLKVLNVCVVSYPQFSIYIYIYTHTRLYIYIYIYTRLYIKATLKIHAQQKYM